MLTNDELLNILEGLRMILLERINIMQKTPDYHGDLLQRNIKILKQLDETIFRLENENAG